jgi:hypothetical protein
MRQASGRRSNDAFGNLARWKAGLFTYYSYETNQCGGDDAAKGRRGTFVYRGAADLGDNPENGTVTYSTIRLAGDNVARGARPVQYGVGG